MCHRLVSLTFLIVWFARSEYVSADDPQFKPVQPREFAHARITDVWAEFADVLTFGRGQTLALLDDGCRPNLPEAMMAIFQKTGRPVDDPATDITFRRLAVYAALTYVLKTDKGRR